MAEAPTFEIDEDSLPALRLPYAAEEFVAVTEEMSQKETTTADLAVVNTYLGACHAALPHVRTIDSLCKLSLTVAKLIEVRRKVKELPWGKSVSVNASSGRTWEVIE